VVRPDEGVEVDQVTGIGRQTGSRAVAHPRTVPGQRAA
jgi:hypothetical protein